MEDYAIRERERQRNTASKYDFVKVKVWLSQSPGGESHYYVMSRYLTCRMLTVTKIPHQKAVKIAMDLKKTLVDENLLNVKQEKMEAKLFSIMEERGFGNDFIRRYKLVSRFFQQRRPLIVLICGIPFTGKSTIAQALASRFNMPNVLQTDVMNKLLRDSEADLLHSLPLWERHDLGAAQLIAEFQREARVVRKAVSGDLTKAVRDGKSVIIEGMHNDPGLYLYEFSRCGLTHLQEPLTLAGDPALKRPFPSLKSRLAAQEYSNIEAPGGVPPQEASLSVRSYKKIASFALRLSGPEGQLQITPAAQLPPSEQASAPMAIQQTSQSQQQAADSPSLKSPGQQWLHYLGIADHGQQQDDSSAAPSHEHEDMSNGQPPASASIEHAESASGRDESQPSHTFSARSWLGSKSRQFFGLPPRASQKQPLDSRPQQPPTARDARSEPKVDEARLDQQPGVAVKHRPQGPLPAEPLTQSNGHAQQSAEAPAEDSPRQPHVTFESMGSFKAPETVFSNPQEQEVKLLEVRLPLDRRKERYKHLGSLDRVSGRTQALKGFQSKTHSLSLPGSMHASEQDGSSAEDRDTLRRGALNPKLELQDHGSVSLAYSEQDHSEDSENTDTSADPLALLKEAPPAWGAQSSTTQQRQKSLVGQEGTPFQHPVSGPSQGPQPQSASLEAKPDGHNPPESRASGAEPADASELEGEACAQQTASHHTPDCQGPVFVPIVMTMDKADQDMLLQQRYANDLGSAALPVVRDQMRILQDYLISYQDRGVPVFSTSLTGMKATMNLLHDYLLECINIQMSEEDQNL